jgi:hypothetical protein
MNHYPTFEIESDTKQCFNVLCCKGGADVIKSRFWQPTSIVLIPLLTLVLCLNLFLSFSINPTTAEAAGPAYSQGAGTPVRPYSITTEADLNSLADSRNSTFPVPVFYFPWFMQITPAQPADKYNVTASIAPSAAQTAGCSVSGTGAVTENATVNLRANVVNGWTFRNWSSSDITISNATANPLTFTMPNKPVAVTVTFSQVTYQVTASITPSTAQTAGCNVTGTGSVSANASVNLQANIVSGWIFNNWSSSDITITNPAANPLNFTMPSKPVAVTAAFSPAALTSTTATVTSNLNPSTYGQNVTISANVTAAVGIPTGTVTFKDGAATLGTGTLSAGIATYSTSTLTTGNHSITAVYGGNSNFSGSTSSALTQTVNSNLGYNPGPSGPGGGGGGSAPTSVSGIGTINVGSIVTASGLFNQSATLTSSDSMSTVSIPKGTTGTVAGSSLNTITVTPQATPPPPSANLKLVGTVYDFSPSGAIFNPPISLSFGYNPANIPAEVSETSLGIAFYDATASQWVAIPDSAVNAEGYTISVQANHFSNFAVVAVIPTPPVPSSTPTLTPTPGATGVPSATSPPTPPGLAPTLTVPPVQSVTPPPASPIPIPVIAATSPPMSSAATPSPTSPNNIPIHVIISIFIGVATIVVLSLMVIRRRRE